MGMTKLLFRTSKGSSTIPANSTVNLTAMIPGEEGLVVKKYPGIRIVCGNRTSSKAVVIIKVILTEGNELLGLLLNIPIAPGEEYSNVFPIPGTALTITATAGNGDAYIDLAVYGYNPDAKSWCGEELLC